MRRYIPEDGTLHNHRCKNLKSNALQIFTPKGPETILGHKKDEVGNFGYYTMRNFIIHIPSIIRILISWRLRQVMCILNFGEETSWKMAIGRPRK
jgi:hypothetical protein